MAAQLAHSYVFGAKSDVTNGIAFLDESTVVYPSGHAIVHFNADTKAQRIVGASISSRGVTATVTSPNKRFTAYAECTSDRPSLTVHDWSTNRRRKYIASVEVGSSIIHTMTFSHDCRWLFLQGGAPDWHLIVLGWEKGKVVATFKNVSPKGEPVECIQCCPYDPSVIMVCGNGFLRQFRVLEGALKPIVVNLKREPQFFHSMVWIDEERFIVGCGSGEIMLFESNEFKAVLPSSPTDGTAIRHLLTYEKGFIAGGNHGVVMLFDIQEEAREMYKLSKRFAIPNDPSDLVGIAMSTSEDNMAIMSASGQMYLLSLANTEVMKADDIVFDPLVTPFHGAGESGARQITGMDTCIRKPLLATCGVDKTIRLWNVSGEPNHPPHLQLMQRFAEEAHSISLAPSGFSVLVGFESGLHLMNILKDGFRSVKEYAIKNCVECRFSNGGHLFAAANSTVVQVFNTFNGELVSTLRAHTEKVLAVSWSPDDRFLVTSGMDGIVYRWNVRAGVAEAHREVKDCAIYSLSHTMATAGSAQVPDVFAVGENAADRNRAPFMQLSLTAGARTAPKVDIELSGAMFGQVVVAPGCKHVFAASCDPARLGVIRAYKYPITGEFQDFVCAAGPITRMSLSHDETQLFVAGIDGTLSVFTTSMAVSRAAHRARERDTTAYAEEILVTRSHIEESRMLMRELRGKVSELKLHNNYQLRLKEINYSEKLREVEEKFKEQLAEDQARYAQLRREKLDMEETYDTKITDLEDQQEQELTDLEVHYKTKIQQEIERYDRLVRDRDRMNEEWDTQNAELVEAQEKQVAQVKEDFERQLATERTQKVRLEQSKHKLEDNIDGETGAIERDADSEIDLLKAKYDMRLAKEHKQTLMLRGENGIMKTKFADLNHKLDQQKEELRMFVEKEKELYETIRGLEKDIQGHKKEIREREETIVDKEKRIYDLRKKNQELEKFKFVLNYKIQELKRQILPRKKEILDMREQIKEMELELLQYHKGNAALDLMIRELKLKKSGLQGELDVLSGRLTTAAQSIQKFQLDLHLCAQHIGDYKNLKEQVTQLYHRYITRGDELERKAAEGPAPDATSGLGGESDAQAEYARQREHLERTVEGLNHKLDKEMKLHQSDRAKLMRENTVLTKEISNLKRQIQALKAEAERAQYNIAPEPLSEATAAAIAANSGPTPRPNPKKPASKPAAGGTAPRATRRVTARRTMSLGGTVMSATSESDAAAGGGGGTGRLQPLDATGVTTATVSGPSAQAPPMTPAQLEGIRKEVDMQRSTIIDLRHQLSRLRAVVSAEPSLGRAVADGVVVGTGGGADAVRPGSREKYLAPLRHSYAPEVVPEEDEDLDPEHEHPGMLSTLPQGSATGPTSGYGGSSSALEAEGDSKFDAEM